jgi:hypothetical protein
VPPRQLIRLSESRRSDSFDDQKTASQIAASETLSENHQQFLEFVISQIKRIIYGDQAGNWHDDPVSALGSDASLYGLLNQNLPHSTIPVACLATDVVGDSMCMRGNMTGDKWRVEHADPFDQTKTPAVGVLISKSTPTVGVMQRLGQVTGIYTGLDVTKPTFVGTDGKIVQTLPSATPGNLVRIQKFGFPIAPDVLWLTGELGPIYTLRG